MHLSNRHSFPKVTTYRQNKLKNQYLKALDIDYCYYFIIIIIFLPFYCFYIGLCRFTKCIQIMVITFLDFWNFPDQKYLF
jgi:hypothetical protein